MPASCNLFVRMQAQAAGRAVRMVVFREGAENSARGGRAPLCEVAHFCSRQPFRDTKKRPERELRPLEV